MGILSQALIIFLLRKTKIRLQEKEELGDTKEEATPYWEVMVCINFQF
jgi:hypothetical protein